VQFLKASRLDGPATVATGSFHHVYRSFSARRHRVHRRHSSRQPVYQRSDAHRSDRLISFKTLGLKVQVMNNSFTLDRRNGKIMGVCAGLSNRSGLDVTLIRVAVVLLTLCALGPIGVVAYLLAGWLAEG